MLNREDESTFPGPFLQTLRFLLQANVASRPDISAFLGSEYFRDMQSRTIRYLEKILEKDVHSRVQFLKKLPQVLSIFDCDTLLRHVLPPLTLQLKDEKLCIFALPAILELAVKVDSQKAHDAEVSTSIMPVILPLISRRDAPQIPFVFLKHLDFLLKRTSNDERRDLVGLLCLADQCHLVVIALCRLCLYSHIH